MNAHDEGDLSDRLGLVERDLAGLKSGVSSIQVDMGRLMSRFDERSKTPWSAMLAAGGLMLSIVIAIGTLDRTATHGKIDAGDRGLDSKIDATARFYERAGDERNRRLDQIEQAQRDADDALDERLQREMRDLNAVDAAVDAGHRDQITELRRSVVSIDERLNDVEVDRSGVVIAGRHEDLAARVASMERTASAHTVALADVAAQIDAVSRTLADMRRTGAGD